MNVDERRHAAEAAGLAPAEKLPEVGDWGFCIYGDAPPAMGGGMPWFYWFASRDEGLSYLREHGAFIHPDVFSKTTAENMAFNVEVIVDAAQATESDNDLETKLNSSLKGSTQFEWLGSYNELLHGNGEFARRVRAGFRGLHDDSARSRDAEIVQDEVTEFGQFTRDYGV